MHIVLLNQFRFSDGLIWKGRLLKIFGPYTFKFFTPKVSWFRSGVSRFTLYCSVINVLFSLTLKILFINSRFRDFFVLYILIHKILDLYTLILGYFAFLINLHEILSKYCIKIETLFWRHSILFRDLAVENMLTREHYSKFAIM